jgi:hypothetical protein
MKNQKIIKICEEKFIYLGHYILILFNKNEV